MYCPDSFFDDHIMFCTTVWKYSQEFVSDMGACTNKIEGYWGVLEERIMRMHGIRNEKLNGY